MDIEKLWCPLRSVLGGRSVGRYHYPFLKLFVPHPRFQGSLLSLLNEVLDVQGVEFQDRSINVDIEFMEKNLLFKVMEVK